MQPTNLEIDMQEYLNNYLAEQEKALKSIDPVKVEEVIKIFRECVQDDRQIFMFGNGGSASNVSHFVTDLGKSSSDKMFRRFRCLSLNENLSWITAIGNDYAYEDIYVRQLENYARAGDVVMMLSVSGNSPNLVKAAEWCKIKQVRTISLVGAAKGRLYDISDHSIVIDSAHYGRVEDCQMHICHMICYAFVENESLQAE